MRKFYRFIAGLFSIAVMTMLTAALVIGERLPDHYFVAKGASFDVVPEYQLVSCGPKKSSYPLAVYTSAGNSFQMDLKFMGLIHIKDVNVQVVDRKVVSLCGTPFGIKMVTDGVMVVGMGNIQSSQTTINPAKEAGIQEGDVILSINNEKISSKKEVSQVVNECVGKPVAVTVRRNDKILDYIVNPVLSTVDNKYHIGIWVRDSSAGIGTMTFYDPDSQTFAGLGHAICDVDTGQIMPLSQGEIVSAAITGVKPGRSGSPGELQGAFVTDLAWGELCANSYNGVYGRLYTAPAYAQPIPMAQAHEVNVGPAKMVTTVEGGKPRYYDILIDRVSQDQDEPTKNLVIRIVDQDLLNKSGGIVQGMSGSPIIQDGMLVGAVTHVFVNDPTRGYGIYAENMANTLASVASSLKSAS